MAFWPLPRSLPTPEAAAFGEAVLLFLQLIAVFAAQDDIKAWKLDAQAPRWQRYGLGGKPHAAKALRVKYKAAEEIGKKLLICW